MRSIAARHMFAGGASLIASLTVYYTLPKPLPELTRVELIAEIRVGHVRR